MDTVSGKMGDSRKSRKERPEMKSSNERNDLHGPSRLSELHKHHINLEKCNAKRGKDVIERAGAGEMPQSVKAMLKPKTYEEQNTEHPICGTVIKCATVKWEQQERQRKSKRRFVFK